MAKYRVTAPDGGTYEITAPDEATPDDVMKFMQGNLASSPVENPTTSGKSFGAASGPSMGILQGAGLNFADEAMSGIAAAGQTAKDFIEDRDFSKIPGHFEANYNMALPQTREMEANYNRAHPVSSTASQIGGAMLGMGLAPELGIGKWAAGAESLPGAMARGAAVGGGYGAVSGFGSGSGDAKNRALSALEGAGIGGVMGAAFPAIAEGAKAAGRMVGRLLAPSQGVSAQTAQLAQRAEELGVPLRPGQISETPSVKVLDSVLKDMPFTGYQELQDSQRRAFNRAVSKTFGEDADIITPDVMQKAKDRIGQMFDDVAANTTIKADDDLRGALTKVVSEAGEALTPDEAAIVAKQASKIIPAQGEDISGAAYQALTRKGAPLERLMSSSNPNLRFYAGQIRSALDDALDRYAPDDVRDMLTTARSQYKNMKTVEDLAEKAVDGNVSPALLLNQVRKSYPRYAYEGAGDIGDLAKIGQRFIKDSVPNSGTPMRNFVIGALGGSVLGPINLGLAAGGGALASKAVNSDSYRRALLAAALKRTAEGGSQAATYQYMARLAPYGVNPVSAGLIKALNQP